MATINVMDVTEANFQTDVMDRSRQLPVIVDFWAQWCGPCRQLGPVLERAVAERPGKVELAKVDVDANPGLARSFRIQGIPAVKAFRDGQVVSEFTGAQRPEMVERFIDALVPSEAEGLITRGDEASLRRALELEPRRADAAYALARILHARGEDGEALELLSGAPGDFAAEGLKARIELGRALADGSLPAPPGLADGLEAADAADHERSLELLLAALASADGHRDDVRRVIVGILAELGPDDPLARESRRKLAAALY
jgi:putative thioredoxin